jgi:hypothetical protein
MLYIKQNKSSRDIPRISSEEPSQFFPLIRPILPTDSSNPSDKTPFYQLVSGLIPNFPL